MGKWAFYKNFFSNLRKSTKKGLFWPKNSTSRSLFAIFHAHFCFVKVGKSPLFLGFFTKMKSRCSTKLPKNRKKPTFAKLKVGTEMAIIDQSETPLHQRRGVPPDQSNLFPGLFQTTPITFMRVVVLAAPF